MCFSDLTTYEILSLVISFIAALGTISAVIVALYLALDKNTPKISAQIYRGEAYYGDGTPAIECIVFRIVNKSQRKIKITNISWRLKKDKKALHYMPTFGGPINNGKSTPLYIDVGDEDRLVVPIEKLKKKEDTPKEFFDELKLTRDIFVVIFEATKDKPFEFKISKEIFKGIW